MFDTLLVSKQSDSLKIAAMRNEVVWQFFYEKASLPSGRLDDIYYGRVRRITSSFIWIDIGLKELAVLKASPATKKFREGQGLLVQITREPLEEGQSYGNSKGVRVSQSIHLAGRYCLYHPYKPHNVFSTELTQDSKQDLVRIASREEGYTFRAACNEVKDLALIQDEMQNLKEEWIALKHTDLQKPGLLKQGLSPLFRLLRDASYATTVIFDDLTLFANSKKFVQSCNAPLVGQLRVALQNELPLFEHFSAEDTWQSLTESFVPFNKGGSLYIEQTACVATIDVNGKEASPEEINQLAVPEIVRQICLRQLSGNMLIDFIRVTREEKPKLLNAFKKQLEADGLKDLKILGWSHAGFLELQCQRFQMSLPERIKKLG